ncbi:MAG: tRNA pseudouridine(55) synthase TruB [Candidatus Eisenbacteria bacterium RBG_16_71_46]|nr:MAG: tRNA pseudouridine(55) synthase TruB [Candidatus Eisenbacteria bacterium RBG_16_71_46]OGF22801.1 MAG: tRNA pseudouridine(55) synthase TruB [Candidatus Eisenbacteria bacterium RBG_19FT_COMBO_70_11]
MTPAFAPGAPIAPPRAAPPEWSGLLAFDKPVGMTSHDVVARVRRRLRVKLAGHLGTLDPGASGLLLVAVGAATRCVPVWQGGEKTYLATVRLGVVTSTQDLQGEVLERHEVRVSETDVRAAALALVGEIAQVPPMVSALRHGGRRLYQLARRGEVVERAPRRVRVAAWEWQGFDLPEARFLVRCSGGTYVRTLAHDLGARLGVGGALAALRRLRSEPFGLEGAIALPDLDRGPREAILARGTPLAGALGVLPAVVLDAEQAEMLGHGGRPAVALGEGGVSAALFGRGPRSIVARAENGDPLALGELAPDPEDPGRARVCPHVVFPWAVRTGRRERGEP